MSASSPRQDPGRLRLLLSPVVAAVGYELDEVTVQQAGRRSIVRVVVDAEGGIDLDGVAAASRAVSEALDADGSSAFAAPYVLEVSSPGVDRPLVEPRHWRRAVGRLVEVPLDGRPVTGRVTGVNDDGAELERDGRRESVPWARLGTGRMQVEFSRPRTDRPEDADGDADGSDDVEEVDEFEPDEES